MTNLKFKVIEKLHTVASKHSRCQKCAVNSLCLPTGLSKKEMIELESIIKTSQNIQKNAPLYHMGQNFENLYVVQTGMFKTVNVDTNGKEKILSIYLPGELMGLGAIHTHKYQSTSVALLDSSYCKVPFKQLTHMSSDFPVLQKNLFNVMSKEINTCKQTHIDLDSTAKLALFIDNISQRFKLRGYSANEFVLPISQRDIANYLGMAEETLSRIFKKLVKMNVITYKKHILQILNRDLLIDQYS